ncbi:DEAD/DEAH box helicase family protein [Aurantimonas coralicida]|uniref:DEAD/DEAH box helicase family protein n=1 Tax=Aurantimonas coralicida TaxID=182270 RepID=UPI001D18E983|nr:DEAD/DEAH box helicase family protein [Aurantimonas coralicida]MCC4298447.1 hypothetical protein [Aurantimonas coralicida]
MKDPEILAILGANPGWKIVDPTKIPDSNEGPGRYVVAESTSSSEIIFGSLGPMCHENGWCVFPQQRTGRRLPSIYRRKAIKWGLYQEERPTAALVGRWARPCFNENVALILGAVSGNTFCLDIDILDWRLASAVENIAFEILGFSGFKRVGRAPKRALLYRVATAEELPANISRFFVDEDGESASPHGFEILSNKKTLTIYGRHHETYDRFSWDGDYQPAITTPADVPLVTPTQISEFMSKVAEFRPFHRNSSNTVIDLDALGFVKTDGVNLPKISSNGDWVEEDDLVTDGREKFLFALARLSARSNPGNCKDEEGRKVLIRTVLEEFQSRARLDGRWGSPNELLREVTDKVTRAAEAIVDGRITPIAPRSRKVRKVAEKTSIATGSPITDGCKGSLAWLPPAEIRGPIKNTPFSEIRCGDAEYAARQIPETAAETSAHVSSETKRLVGAFFADLEADDEHPRTHVVVAPTGAGKTHITIDAIKRFHETREAGDEPFPILVLVPTYKNIEESAAKARAAGLRVVEWIGKARSGELTTEDRCIKPGEVATMQKAGRNTANLCQAVDPDDDKKMIRCGAWDEKIGAWSCRYMRQSIEAQTAEVIFAVHAYISCSLPAALKACRAVVIDESFHGQLIKAHRFSDEVLLLPRDPVAFRTKREKAANIELEDFIAARQEVAGRVYYALRDGRDPVDWFLATDSSTPAIKMDQLSLTIALLSRVRDGDDITPRTSLKRIEALCAGPERTAVHEEEKLWRLLKDRIVLHRDGILDSKKDGRVLWQRGADKEAAGEIRISWISEHNFENHPILALDASADKALVARVLDRKETEIVCEPIDALLRVRTVHVPGKSLSKTSILPRKSDTESYAAYKSRLTHEMRILISTIASVHTEGGIVVCTPKSVKDHLLDGWSAPQRVIWMHYGYTKGFNVAERCDAAIALGCINPSITQLDDIVAALAFGESDPEPLRDPVGEHRGHDLDRIYKTDTVRLRNGYEMTVTQDGTEGRYSEMALRQIRTEEHLQFLGRLRPIHRDKITAFYNVGSYIPPSLIVDEVVDFEDLMSWIGSAVEVAREHQGPIGAGDTIEESKAAAKFSKILEMGETRSRFFEVTAAGEVLYVPAHTPSVVDRLVEDGYQITHRPTLGKMEEFPAPICTYADEVRFRDRALAAAMADGWSAMPGSRMWTRDVPADFDPTATNDKPITALDVAVLAQHYHVRLRRQEREAEAAAAPKTAMQIFETEVF